MKALLVLMSLYSLCTLSLSQECRRDLLENIDFPGTDITHLYSPDVDHCQWLCTQHPGCLFFTFLRHDWTADNRNFYCYIKSTPSGEPNRKTPLRGVTSGYSLKSCNSETAESPGDHKPCLSQVYEDMDFPGADYRFLFTHDYKECQRACTDDPACQFFTFVDEVFTPERIRYKCHLKYSWTIPRTPIVERKAGTVSGFSHKVEMSETFSTACQGQLFENADIPGSDIERLPAVSPQHCRALCSTHPTCTYFSYVSASFTCHLKKNPNEMVFAAKEGVTSGLPAHFCQLDNNWIMASQIGVDFRGSDIRFELMDDAESCQRTCTNDPQCQFYTYVTEEFSDRNYWRRCYLKRVITLPAPPVVTKLNNVISGFSMKNCY